MSSLHIPVGGSRFRPCLDDFIQFLIWECRFDALPDWRPQVEAGRERWHLRQGAAVVRDVPGRQVVKAPALTGKPFRTVGEASRERRLAWIAKASGADLSGRQAFKFNPRLGEGRCVCAARSATPRTPSWRRAFRSPPATGGRPGRRHGLLVWGTRRLLAGIWPGDEGADVLGRIGLAVRDRSRAHRGHSRRQPPHQGVPIACCKRATTFDYIERGDDPGASTMAGKIGNTDYADRKSSLADFAATAGQAPGECTTIALASDNPGCNVNALPAPRLKDVIESAGPGY